MVLEKNDLAWPLEVRIDDIPVEPDFSDRPQSRSRMFRKHTHTHLALPFPALQVFYLTSPADVHVLSSSDEHVAGGHDICDRRNARVVPTYPYGDRNVVWCATVGNG